MNETELLEALQRTMAALKQVKQRARELEDAARAPVAIVGIGCRFAGGVTGPDALWELLESGADAIVEVPRDRWDVDEFYDPDPDAAGKMVTRSAGFLADVYGFDSEFFGVAPREARRMDPQQRVLLEIAWEALEHAGIVPETLMGSATGVFVGINTQEYATPHLGELADLDGYVLTGTHASVASGRISYVLGLRGPSITLDTACSSSLVATHLACQSLRARECDAALAGGVGLLLAPTLHVEFSRLRGLAADGRCKSFDAAADGMGWGEGCAVVVLKRLSDAQRDGNRIWAVLRGSAVNQDGRSNGLTAPNGPSQEDVISGALERAGVRPLDIGYVETHGAGTPLGDPIEAQALGAVLGEGRSAANPVYVGAIKSNIGHTMAAAGAAGLIKTVLMLNHRRIPKNLHFSTPSRHIPWDRLAIKVPTESIPWDTNDGAPRIAGVSSFGVSGTNAHVVVEEPPAATPPAPAPAPERDRAAHLLVLSAKTPEALPHQIERYAEYLDAHPDTPFADVCHAAATTRTHFEERIAIVASSSDEARDRLLATARGETAPSCVSGQVASGRGPKVAFLFAGQGSQYAGMGRELYDVEPVFRDAMDRSARILDPLLERPLLSVLYPEDGQSTPLDETAYTQPALFAFEYALAELFRSWGITPEVVMGHSVGEVVAACTAGVLSLEDGLTLIAARGRLMHSLPPDGEMASVKLDAATVQAHIAPYGDDVSIGAYNGPESVVISGLRDRVRAICRELEARGVKTKTMNISIASHSRLMDPILDEFERVAAGLSYRGLGQKAPEGDPELQASKWPSQRRIKLVSNLTGRVAGDEIGAPGYWRRHIREPVRFEQGMRAIRELGVDTFLEIGPQSTLIGMGALCVPDDGCAWLPSQKKGAPAWPILLESVGRLYVRGAPVDWTRFDAPFSRKRVSLPTYAFHRQHYRVERPRYAASSSSPARLANEKPGAYALSGAAIDVPGESIHRAVQLGPTHQPYLNDHLVHGRMAVPGSLHVAVLLAVAADAFGARDATVRDFQLLRPLVVEKDVTLHVVLTPASDGGFTFTLCTPREESDGGRTSWIAHAAGTLVLSAKRRAAPAPLDELRRACSTTHTADQVFTQFAEMDITMGPQWRWLDEAFSGERAGLVGVKTIAGASPSEAPLHPALIDNAFAAAVLALPFRVNDGDAAPFLLWGIRELRWYGERASAVWSYARGQSTGGETRASDLVLVDDADRALLEIDGLTFKRAEKATFASLVAPDTTSSLFALDWPVQESSTSPSRGRVAGRWCILTDDSSFGAELATRFTDARAATTIGAIADAEEIMRGAEDAGPFDGVIVWWRPPTDRADARGAGSPGGALRPEAPSSALEQDPAEQAQARSVEALAVIRAIAGAHRATPRRPRLFWVTEGGQAVRETDVPAPDATTLWGLARAAAEEHPELGWTLVDLGAAAPGAVESLWQAVRRSDDETELAIRSGKRHVARLVRAPSAPPRALTLRPCTVLITGGLGGLGLRVAEWLSSERGVRHLLLVGRSAPSPERAARIEALRASGAVVTVAHADVARAEDVAKLLASIPAEAPLSGVVHAAGVARAAKLAELDATVFASVFVPKAAGAWNLHEQTRSMDLDFFVLFSSIQSTVGSATQASYAAANAFLDGLAHHRHAQGLVCQSLNWGAWSGEGMASRFDEAERLRLARVGFGMHTPEEGLRLMGAALARPEPQLMLARLDVGAIQRVLAGDEAAPIFRALVRRSPGRTSEVRGAAFREQLRALSPVERERAVLDLVRAEVAAALRLASPAAAALDRPLEQLGLDSLMALEIPNRLKARTAESYPSTLLYDHPTVRAIAAVVMQKMGFGAEGADRRPGAPSVKTMGFGAEGAERRPGAPSVNMGLDAQPPSRPAVPVEPRASRQEPSVSIDAATDEQLFSMIDDDSSGLG